MARTTSGRTGSPSGPLGFSNAALGAAGVMVLASLLTAGWGMTQVAQADETAEAPAEPSPSEVELQVEQASLLPGSDTGEVALVVPTDSTAAGELTLRLPDVDGNGVPDIFEADRWDENGDLIEAMPGDSVVEADDGAPGLEPDTSTAPGTNDDSGLDEDRTVEVYVIREGDTLSLISGQTGVPLDILVEVNHIPNPHLIYTGAALLVPSNLLD